MTFDFAQVRRTMIASVVLLASTAFPVDGQENSAIRPPREKTPADVLLLVPGTSTLGWSDEIVEEFLTEFTGGKQQAASKIKILHHEPSETEADKFVYSEKLRTELKAFDFKLVIAHADYAERLAAILNESGLSSARILFFNAPEDFAPEKFKPLKVSSIIRDRDAIRILDMARSLMDAETIFFLIGYDENRSQENSIRRAIAQDKRFASCKTIFLRDTELSPDEAAALVAAEKQNAYIIKLSPWRDKNTSLMMRGIAIAMKMNKASGGRHLFLANSSYGLGHGLAGGYFLDPKDYAKLISETAHSIIDTGEDTQAITVSKPVLDIAVLNNLGIPLSRIPSAITITNSAPPPKGSTAMTILLILIPAILAAGLLLAVLETMRRKRIVFNTALAKKFVLAIPLPFIVFDQKGRIIERDSNLPETLVREMDSSLGGIESLSAHVKRILEVFEQENPIEIKLRGSTLKVIKLRKEVFAQDNCAILFFLKEHANEDYIKSLAQEKENALDENELLRAMLELSPYGAAARAPDDDFTTLLSNTKYDSVISGVDKSAVPQLMRHELETLYSGMDRKIQVVSGGEKYEFTLRMTIRRNGTNVIIESAVKDRSTSSSNHQ